MQNQITYTFGPFRLDTGSQILWHGQKQIDLTPKVYRLLHHLVQHQGRLVSHEELISNVWSGRITDNSAIRVAVNALRKALSENIASPLYISTINKNGYRFLSDVTITTSIQNNNFNDGNPLNYRAQPQPFNNSNDVSLELDILRKAFERSAIGQRHMIFLSGEQGSGKTTLLDKFLSNLDHLELAVLRARCVQMYCNSEAYLPLLEALARRCCEPYGRWLVEHLNHIAPSWLYQIRNGINPNFEDILATKLKHSNIARMLREGADFLDGLSKQTPFILILDNAHWSDLSTLDLFNFLMYRCSPAKLLVIISYRPSMDSEIPQRIQKMRNELSHRGLCQEVNVQGSRIDDKGCTSATMKRT
jgi:DNA-binding winged helix-turn-helix (wHTH) protein